MKDEEILRQQAIELHLKGIAVVDITDKLGKSRQWVHKWLKRYKSGDDKWYLSLSNAPKKPIKTIPKDIENMVISIRKKLNSQKYAQKGALNILYEFERLNIKSPSLSTINRIIYRNGLIDRGTKREAKKKSIQITSQMFNKWILWVLSTSGVAADITYLILLLLNHIMPEFIPYQIRLQRV
jgi:putative transposase